MTRWLDLGSLAPLMATATACACIGGGARGCGGAPPGQRAPGESMGRLSAGAGHTCAVAADTRVYCWGSNPDGQLGIGSERDAPSPTLVPDLAGIRGVSAGSYHTCALTTGDAVSCWGWNVGGQIGDGIIANRLTPFQLQPLGPGGAVALAMGSYHSCALLGDGSERCWGQNDYGQLGNGAETNSGSPVGVFSLPPTAAIAAGGRHSCARLEDSTVQCWGGNDVGELGDGTTAAHSFPEPVTGLNDAIAVAAGFNHSCALRAGGQVTCWGANGYGQLGDGTTVDSPLPVAVGGLEGALAIAAGYNHTCAVLAGGGLRCWGWNAAGQLGDGTMTDSAAPIAVPGLPDDVIAIAGGGFHTCAATADGAVACWGSNDSGQLGDGTTIGRASPGQVAGVTL